MRVRAYGIDLIRTKLKTLDLIRISKVNKRTWKIACWTKMIRWGVIFISSWNVESQVLKWREVRGCRRCLLSIPWLTRAQWEWGEDYYRWRI